MKMTLSTIGASTKLSECVHTVLHCSVSTVFYAYRYIRADLYFVPIEPQYGLFKYSRKFFVAFKFRGFCG